MNFAFKKSITKSCDHAVLNVNGKDYLLIDTPGFSDPIVATDDETWKKIGSIALKCASGVRAVLFVIREFFNALYSKSIIILFHLKRFLKSILYFYHSLAAGRYTSSQQGIIEKAVDILDLRSMNNITAVFTHCNKANTEDPKRLMEKLTEEQKIFLQKINHRYTVIPNPEWFEPRESLTKSRLDYIKNNIDSIEKNFTFSLIKLVRLVCEIQNIKSEPEVDQALDDYEKNAVKDNAKQELIDRLNNIPDQTA